MGGVVDPRGVCGYCWQTPVVMGLCITCRTRKDLLDLKLKDALKQLEYTRKSYYRLINENQSLRRALAKKEGKQR